MSLTDRLHRIRRHLTPAIGFPGWPEVLRASFGMCLAMLVMELFLRPAAENGHDGLFIIAPLGASAVLLICLPNSPLAQPWSALAGNCVSALVGVLCVLLIEDPLARIALATGLSVLAMHACRALHPPGAAVAMTAALSPGMIEEIGFLFVLTPVGLATLALVLISAPFARLTGRRYPFRQPPGPAAGDAPALDRTGLSNEALAGLLLEFRQSANIGVEDLARIIAAAERLSARDPEAELRCDQIMSRDLVTVAPATPLAEVAALFRQHGFTSLPVTGPDRRYMGVIFQIHLIRRGAEEAGLRGSRFAVTLGRILGRDPEALVRAEEVMARDIPHAEPQTPIADLLPLLAAGPCDAVPVLAAGRIEGIVTRTDLIAALARIRG